MRDEGILLRYNNARWRLCGEEVEVAIGASIVHRRILRSMVDHALREVVHLETRSTLGKQGEIGLALRLVELQNSVLGRNCLWGLRLMSLTHLLLHELRVVLRLVLLAHALG